MVAAEGIALNGRLNFSHPLGRFGVLPAYALVSCPARGAIRIDSKFGDFTYISHPFIGGHPDQSQSSIGDSFEFQVRLDGCPSCVDTATSAFPSPHCPWSVKAPLPVFRCPLRRPMTSHDLIDVPRSNRGNRPS